MILADLTQSTNGYARRLLIVALATLMLFATLAVVPGGATAADSDESATDQSAEPAAVVDESTTATTAPPPDEPAAAAGEASNTTTTVAAEDPIVETTTITTPVVEEVAVAPLAEEDEPLSQPLATPPEEDAEPTLSPLDASFGISIEKYTNGIDAPAAPGPTLIIGDPVTWTYVVTNLRHPAIHHIAVHDSDPTVVVRCPTSQLNHIGHSMTCTASGIVLPGQYSNTATVTGKQAGRTVSAQDDSHYFGVEPARIVVDKVTVPSGDPQEFGFTLLGVDNPTDEIFTLADGSTPYDSGPLDPGVYSVEEDDPGDPAVWQLTDVICEDLDNGVEFDDPSSLNLKSGVTITCTFTNAKTPTLNLVKTVTNDNGGDKVAGDWTLTATATAPDPTDRNYSELGDYTAFEPVYANTDYVLAETGGPDHYTPGTWSCDNGVTVTSSTITLAQGQTDVTCTITNNDNAPRLTLAKEVYLDHGGNDTAEAWTLTAAGTSGGFSEQAVREYTNEYFAIVGPKDVTAGVEYTLSESGPAGYSPGDGWSCVVNNGAAVKGDKITLSLSDSARCTIQNYDIQPELRLIKTVTNDDGGDKPASDWDLSAWTHRQGIWYRALNFPDGGGNWLKTYDDPWSNHPYQLAETGPAGYLPGDWSCDGGTLNGSWITFDEGERVTCTIDNDDIAPTLNLVKTVTNDDDGTADAGDWTLTATASAPALIDRNYSETGDHASFETMYANTAYVLAETGPAGYIAGSWSCTGGTLVYSTLTLAPGNTDVTCTITNDDAEATLTLVKTVVNDDGGSLGVADFPLFISGTPVTNGVSHPLLAGTYMASETNQAGYAAGVWGGDCGADGSITLARGQHATCTITNNDIAPTLKLVKTVTNDDGGPSSPNDWTLTATAAAPDPIDKNYSELGDHATFETVYSNAGYVLDESTVAGYTAGDWSCDGGTLSGSTITLAEGETNVTCTIVNDDVAPTLKLVKTVTNNDGGNAVAKDWTLTATAASPNDGRNFHSFGDEGTFTPVYANAGYVLTESVIPGYRAGDWSCVGGSLVESPADVFTVTLGVGEAGVVCTITNNDIAPTLKVIVEVQNGDSGTAVPGDFTAGATATAPDPTDRNYSHPGDHGTFETMYANTQYGLATLSGPDGYLSWLGTCGGSITLTEGQTDVTCSKVVIAQRARLKLVKTVTNDNDGTADAKDWTLTATATDPTWDDKDYSHPGDHATFETVRATEYVLAETGGPTGYTSGTWSCDNGVTVTDSTITVPLTNNAVTDVTCTINNNDDTPPTLKLFKQVGNSHGGSELAAAWTLNATSTSTAGDFSLLADQDTSPDGRLGDTGTQTVNANNEYTLSESGPDGYTQHGQWVCYVDGGAAVEDNKITLSEGESADCWATNNDDAPSLKLVKVVVNNDGGTAHADEWMLGAAGDGGIAPTHGTRVLDTVAVVGPQTVLSNVEYTLSETGPAGYTAGDWTCTITPAGSTTPGSPVTSDKITLGEGESGSCQISNDDVTPTLKLHKAVANDNGGDNVAADWTLTATSTSGEGNFSLLADKNTTPDFLEGDTGTQDVYANNMYTLSESGPDGYTQVGSWECVVMDADGDIGEPFPGNTITLREGEAAECGVNNTDIAPTLKLVKSVTTDDGGTAGPGDWTLTATAASPDDTSRNYSETGDHASFETVFSNAAYVLAESAGPAGYAPGTWSCDKGVTVTGSTISLVEGQTGVTCTINNNDVPPPTLRVIKTVVNDDGGSLAAADFPLFISGTPATSAVSYALSPGTYMASETNQAGYTAGVWGGDCNADGTVTIVVGQHATCTIVNDDIAPTLKLAKDVTTDNGGTAVAGDWTLSATALAPDDDRNYSHPGDHGVFETVYSNAGYVLAETTIAGYTAGDWSCDGGTLVGDTITLAEGDTGVTCTIVNDDDPAHLILVKDVVNDDGGTAVPHDWDLYIEQGTAGEKSVPGTTTGLEVTDQAGTYDLSESMLSGYTNTLITCDNLPDGVPPGAPVTSVTIGLGETVTCTFTNDDDAPSLKLIKHVNNNNGGTAVASEWTLSAGAHSVTGSETAVEVTNQGGTYALSETTVSGYTNTSITCDNAPDTEVTSVTIGVGETITCTFVNDDNAAGIDIEKATNGSDADDPTGPYIHVGDTVTWTYVVTNTGQADLEKILVEDSDRAVSVSCSQTTLAVGEKMSCTATGIAVAGQYENTGHVFGTAVTGAPVEDFDMSHYFGSDPAIGVTKDVAPAVINVGEATEVTWTIIVSNAGNVALRDVAVTDALVADCDKTVGDLAVGGSSTYTCNSTHTPDNLAWTLTNVAVATGVGPAGTQVTANDDAKIVATAVAGTAQIGHIVWRDTDKNGVQDAGEPGINGATVILKDATGAEIARTVTANSSPDGSYKFTGLVAGTYTVQLDTSSVSGELTTAGAFTITLTVGEDYTLANFGLADTLPVTGIESDNLTLLAVGLLMLGVFAVLSTRRRRGEER